MEISSIEIIIGLVVGTLMYLAYKSMVRPANFPPGPLGIPILGSLQLLKEYPEQDMLKLSKTYGNLFSLKTAARNYVCVCGTDANKEVLYHKNIADRPTAYVFYMMKGNQPRGIVHSKFNEWLKANRALMHTVLTDSADEIVDTQTTNMMNELEDYFGSGEPSYIGDLIFASFVTTVVDVLFGSKTVRTKEEKDRIEEIVRTVVTFKETFTGKLFMLPELIPGLHNIWIPESAKKCLETSDTIFKYCAEQVAAYKTRLDTEKTKSLVGLYLDKMDQEKDVQNTVFTKDNFRILLYDIFIAGTENASKTMEFASLYLAAQPDVQRKIHKEITEVLGKNGKVQYQDRLKMHYTIATAFEILRFSSMTPNGVPRKAMKDITLNGYFIPKGTTFLMNSWSSNTQDDRWKNPDNFDPENFLDEGGKFAMNDAFMGFGGGLRKCVGEPLIKTELFVFLVKLVQKFHIKPETDDTKIDEEPHGGVLHTPKPQKLRLQLREVDDHTDST